MQHDTVEQWMRMKQVLLVLATRYNPKVIIQTSPNSSIQRSSKSESQVHKKK
jgi:hypothetical protein